MPLQPGDRVGAYEILSTLGAGGMGVVYRARDAKLGREVAIKTLPEGVAADPDRLARFEREARMLAALNHPNIATVYGFEQADATHFLTMEVVEGATLADRIERGPIPLEQALPLFVQIAQGLEAAHAKSIIHRDLKPANIKIEAGGGPGTRPGAVKILDFGLAKALLPEVDARSVDASQSPTLTLEATMRGEILGTAAYMSPEQAQGLPTDQRTDIWAFGVCLLEALTGRRVFSGANASRVLASVLKDEPDLDALPPSTSPAVRRLLRRCLVKDRERRLHDIADARLELEEAMAMPAGEPAFTPALALRRMPRSWIAIAVAALVAIGLAGGLLVGRSLQQEPEPVPATRFVINPPPNAAGVQNSLPEVAITADGKAVVYVAGTAQGDVLFVRRIDRLDGTAIAGVEPIAGAPFLSPDGRWLGYVNVVERAYTLRKIAIEGGPSLELAKEAITSGASWGPDGTIVFGTRGPLRRVAAAGGEPVDVTELEPGEVAHRHPEFLPGGRAVLFAVFTGTGQDDATIVALTLATGERKVLVRGGSQPRYAASGHLVYAVGSTLRAAAFDPERLELRGEPVPVLENVTRTPRVGAAHYAVSANGALAYVKGGGIADNVLVWVDREGREEPIGAPPRPYVYTRLSPDGTRIALSVLDEERDIWIWDLERETSTRLTVSPAGLDGAPVWSRDGRTVFHLSQLASGGWEVVARNADGTSDPVRISEQQAFVAPTAVTVDGGGLLALRATSSAAAPPFDLVQLDIAARAEPQVLLDEEWSVGYPELSPDGRFLAYGSNESGSDEVYVRPFPALESGKWQVSSGGGTRPLWSRDGSEIFFLDARNYLMASSVTSRDGALAIGRSKVLFERAYVTLVGRSYDVSLDGTRFLMIKTRQAEDGSANRIVYVQNWFDELRRLAPARGN